MVSRIGVARHRNLSCTRPATRLRPKADRAGDISDAQVRRTDRQRHVLAARHLLICCLIEICYLPARVVMKKMEGLARTGESDGVHKNE